MGTYNSDKKSESIGRMSAGCVVTGEIFDILVEREEGRVILMQGIRSPAAAPAEKRGKFGRVIGSDKGIKGSSMKTDGGVFTSETYHCPICGNKGVVRCGRCFSITCNDMSGSFMCVSCGNSGRVVGSISEIKVERGGKPQFSGDKSSVSGSKPQFGGDKSAVSGKPRLRGDKTYPLGDK